jgi:hypothetical protein
MRAPPSERDQKAMDVLSRVLRDLRGSSLAFFPAQGGYRDLGPPKETDGIGKGLAQAKADGSIGEPIDGGTRKEASGREFKITRWNAPDGKLAAVLLEPVLGGPRERVLIAPDAKRPAVARRRGARPVGPGAPDHERSPRGQYRCADGYRLSGLVDPLAQASGQVEHELPGHAAGACATRDRPFDRLGA